MEIERRTVMSLARLAVNKFLCERQRGAKLVFSVKTKDVIDDTHIGDQRSDWALSRDKINPKV